MSFFASFVLKLQTGEFLPLVAREATPYSQKIHLAQKHRIIKHFYRRSIKKDLLIYSCDCGMKAWRSRKTEPSLYRTMFIQSWECSTRISTSNIMLRTYVRISNGLRGQQNLAFCPWPLKFLNNSRTNKKHFQSGFYHCNLFHCEQKLNEA